MIYIWKKQLAKNDDKAFPGKGNPTDPEFSQLKKENARLKEEARGKIFRYIETWYNRLRKHSALQHLSSSEYEFEKENLSLTKAA